MGHQNEIYTCSMHPQIIRDKPGNCPICGMTLVLVKPDAENDMHDHHGANPSMGHAGHDHNSMIADFRKRFYVVLVLTIPIMLLSEMIQHFMGVDWQFTGSKYILFALSTIVFIYGGFPFLKGLVDEVKAKNPGMMFLIGFAISVALDDHGEIVPGAGRQFERDRRWARDRKSVV